MKRVVRLISGRSGRLRFRQANQVMSSSGLSERPKRGHVGPTIDDSEITMCSRR